MGQDAVREDFLVGRNGAATLTEADLKLLDDLYPVVTPKHEPGDATAFANQVQAAAEHLLAVVDGKQKEVFGGSYGQIKEVIGKIHESGYLDQAAATEYEEPIEAVEQPAELNCNPVVPEVLQPPPQEVLPALEAVTIEPPRPLAPAPVEQAPMDQLPPEQQIYYQQPPPRPITEVLGTGSFFFLQDSELDTPDTLPTQTFTNTSYVQAPPPPIPLPPNFQTYPNVPPPGNGVEEPAPQQPPQPPQPEDGQKHRGQPPRPNNYYQNNNNSYNNRPRQQRNGPRSGNRHQ